MLFLFQTENWESKQMHSEVNIYVAAKPSIKLEILRCKQKTVPYKHSSFIYKDRQFRMKQVIEGMAQVHFLGLGFCSC